MIPQCVFSVLRLAVHLAGKQLDIRFENDPEAILLKHTKTQSI
jgi:hypothetical protein